MENKLKMILAIVNNKGGVGKTTTVQNLATGMLRKDKNLRILEIDLDPQCNLTLLNHAPEDCATVFDSMIACKGLPIYKNGVGVYYVPGSAKMQDASFPAEHGCTTPGIGSLSQQRLHGFHGRRHRQSYRLFRLHLHRLSASPVTVYL